MLNSVPNSPPSIASKRANTANVLSFFTVWTIGPPSKTAVERVISSQQETSIFFDDSEVGSAVFIRAACCYSKL